MTSEEAKTELFDRMEKEMQTESARRLHQWEAKINDVFHLNTLRLQYAAGSTQYRRADYPGITKAVRSYISLCRH